MDKIYELNDGTKLILYSHSHSVYTYSLPAKNNSVPMSIASDYDSMLDSCIFDSTVYYIYKNTSGSLILANLLFHNPHTVFSDEAQIFSPFINGLFAIKERMLCAIVTIKNPLNQNFALEIWEVRPDFKRMSLPTVFADRPSIEVTELNHILYIFEIGEGISQLLQIYEPTLCDLFDKAKEDEIDRPDIYRLLSARPLPDSAGASPDGVSGACEECRKKDRQIQELTRQYNELVETARQIQQEGKQWKSRYRAQQKRDKT